MPPLPSDEKLYRAVINLQINQDFEVIRNYIGRRHSEVGGSFHAIKDDMQLHQAQGRAAELVDLYFRKLDPKFARDELEKLETRAKETQAGKKIF